jgi:Protein of unknown function (DUF1579)
VSESPQPPQPDPALRRLDRFVGRWSMEGNLVGSEERNIKGETEFRWLPGGFFLEQRARIDFVGFQIDALELIGYDPASDTFPSTVFSGFSPQPLPYRWDVKGEAVTITVTHVHSTRPSPALGATTAPSRAAGAPIPAPTRA